VAAAPTAGRYQLAATRHQWADVVGERQPAARGQGKRECRLTSAGYIWQQHSDSVARNSAAVQDERQVGMAYSRTVRQPLHKLRHLVLCAHWRTRKLVALINQMPDGILVSEREYGAGAVAGSSHVSRDARPQQRIESVR
jgi:hypothetical protein